MGFFDNFHAGLQANGMRLDASQSAMMQKSLTAVLAEIQETLFSEAIYQQILPIPSPLGSGLTGIDYYRGVPSGEMTLIGSAASDLPRVDESLELNTLTVANYGAAFGWSFIEMERAQRQNYSVDSRKGIIARKTAEKKIDSVVFGESDPKNDKIKGIFGETLTAASGLTGGWASATEQQIIDDVQAVLNAAYNGSGGEFEPDTLVLPSQEYGILKYTVRTNTDSTLMSIIEDRFNVNVMRSARLSSVTSAVNSLVNKPVCLAYKNDSMVAEIRIPRPFQLLPGSWQGLDYQVPFLLDFAGVAHHLPKAIAFGDLS